MYNPSLNTQFCIKGFWWYVRDFCFWATDYKTSLKWVSHFFFLFALYIIKVRLNTLDITHSLTRSLPLFCQQVAFILRKWHASGYALKTGSQWRWNVKNLCRDNLPSLTGIGLWKWLNDVLFQTPSTPKIRHYICTLLRCNSKKLMGTVPSTDYGRPESK